MNQIELTKEQRNNLLKMCKFLYPKLYIQSFSSKDYINLRGEKILYETTEIIHIHWFEFTMTQLADKLFKLFYEAKLWCVFTKESFYVEVLHNKSIHPVDYLYEQFRKLK